MTPQLLLLILLTLVGAWRSAKWEAREMSLQRKIHHWLLVMVRTAAALLLIRLTDGLASLVGPEVHRGLLEYLPPLVMCAGVFGPLHRILLWWYRVNHHPQQNRSLPWHHLSMRGYDLIVACIPGPKTRFITLCALEVLTAMAMLFQSN